MSLVSLSRFAEPNSCCSHLHLHLFDNFRHFDCVLCHVKDTYCCTVLNLTQKLNNTFPRKLESISDYFFQEYMGSLDSIICIQGLGPVSLVLHATSSFFYRATQ